VIPQNKGRDPIIFEVPYLRNSLWVSSNRLKLNAEKTQFTCLGTKYQLAKVDGFVLVANGSVVDLLPVVTCLGVTIDQELTFTDHIQGLTGRCFHCLIQLRPIRWMLTFDTIITIVNTVVISRIDYCNAVLAGVHEVHLWQLQQVLNAAAWLRVRKRKYDNISATMHDALHWLPIRQHVDFKLCVTVFNSLHNLAPNYLSTMCQLVAENPSHQHLRSAACGDLAVPETCTIRYGPRSFTVTGPSTWNSLPAFLSYCHLPSAFRCELKTELFARAFFISTHDRFHCKSGQTLTLSTHHHHIHHELL